MAVGGGDRHDHSMYTSDPRVKCLQRRQIKMKGDRPLIGSLCSTFRLEIVSVFLFVCLFSVLSIFRFSYFSSFLKIFFRSLLIFVWYLPIFSYYYFSLIS